MNKQVPKDVTASIPNSGGAIFSISPLNNTICYTTGFIILVFKVIWVLFQRRCCGINMFGFVYYGFLCGLEDVLLLQTHSTGDISDSRL